MRCCQKCKINKPISEMAMLGQKPLPRCRSCEETRIKNEQLKKEKARTRSRAWQDNNKERSFDIKNSWYQNNKEIVLERSKNHYKANRDKKIAYTRKWQKENREKVNSSNRRRNAERRKNDLQFKLKETIRSRIKSALKVGKLSVSSLSLLGAPTELVKTHLEANFQAGMSWENYGFGEGKWSIDHIIPLNAFDLADLEQAKIACHYLNMKPMWFLDNCSKNASYDKETAEILVDQIKQIIKSSEQVILLTAEELKKQRYKNALDKRTKTLLAQDPAIRSARAKSRANKKSKEEWSAISRAHWSKKTKEQHDIIVGKRNKTVLEKHGVTNVMQLEENKQKLRDSYKSKSKEQIEEEHRIAAETYKAKHGVNNCKQLHINPKIVEFRFNKPVKYRNWIVHMFTKCNKSLKEIAFILGIHRDSVVNDCKRLEIPYVSLHKDLIARRKISSFS